MSLVLVFIIAATSRAEEPIDIGTRLGKASSLSIGEDRLDAYPKFHAHE